MTLALGRWALELVCGNGAAPGHGHQPSLPWGYSLNRAVAADVNALVF